jgi:hypothetical protein
MEVKETLYKKLYLYFNKKDDKSQAIKRYLYKTLTRGGTFWAWYTLSFTLELVLFIEFIILNDEVANHILLSDIYNIIIRFLVALIVCRTLFYPVGLIWGMIRELYFEYDIEINTIVK